MLIHIDFPTPENFPVYQHPNSPHGSFVVDTTPDSSPWPDVKDTSHVMLHVGDPPYYDQLSGYYIYIRGYPQRHPCRPRAARAAAHAHCSAHVHSQGTDPDTDATTADIPDTDATTDGGASAMRTGRAGHRA